MNRNLRGTLMKKEYDFSQAKRNPYSGQLKKTITIRIDEDSITYFKDMADETGLPYQVLMNMYLKDCAENKRKLDIKWTK
ncbi:BrnA antitoxin family protein [Snodgrassella alvi]|nr:BrnA antitoxin family protein [Snodgrassella alvi]